MLQSFIVFLSWAMDVMFLHSDMTFMTEQVISGYKDSRINRICMSLD